MLERYMNYLNEQTGWLNFQEDRYIILKKHKAGYANCLRIPVNTIPGRIKMYQCQIKVASITLQNAQNSSSKCQQTKYPEKCSELYNRMIGPLEEKIKWYQNEIPNLQRKAGTVKY